MRLPAGAGEPDEAQARGGLSTLELVENPDIAAEVGKLRGAKPSVVFALETDDGTVNARAKLGRKNAELCVLSDPSAIGAGSARFTPAALLLDELGL